MHEPITTLVFDLDGTLYADPELGTEITRIAAACIAEITRTGEEEAAVLIRRTRTEITAASGFDTTLSQACTALGADLADLHRRFAAQIRPERHLRRNDGVVELIGSLAERFTLYLYTNNNRTLTTRILAALGLTGFFAGVFTIEYSWRPKPDRQTVEGLLREIGKRPAECLFIGDRYDIDLRIPAEVGCGVCLVGGMDELLHLGKLLHEENL